MNATRIFIILFFIQSLVIITLLQQILNNANNSYFEKEFEQVKFQNQEMKNLLLSINSDNTKATYIINDCQSKNAKTVSLPTKINKNTKEVLSENNEEPRYISLKESNISQENELAIRLSFENSSDKYNSVVDPILKESLIFTDEIIVRAIESGEFAEWEVEQLNKYTADLDSDGKLTIMNKLSEAYRTQKITGKFIKFNLDGKAKKYF